MDAPTKSVIEDGITIHLYLPIKLHFIFVARFLYVNIKNLPRKALISFNVPYECGKLQV